MRLIALAIVVAVALTALFLRARPGPAAVEPPPVLTYVATANQLGVVGYRDPAGAISPDGRFLAYAEGRDLRVVPIAGGASAMFPRADGQVRWVTWIDASRVLADDGGSKTRWWVYDVSGRRDPRCGPLHSVTLARVWLPRPHPLARAPTTCDSRCSASAARGSRRPWPHRTAFSSGARRPMGRAPNRSRTATARPHRRGCPTTRSRVSSWPRAGRASPRPVVPRRSCPRRTSTPSVRLR